MLVALAALGLATVRWAKRSPDARASGHSTAGVLADERAVFSQYAGSASCRECHPQAYDLWAKSHHGLAERRPRPELDDAAFFPGRAFQHASQTTEVRMRAGRYEVVAVGASSNREVHQVERVIGHHPLRQFLVAAPGGRLQTLEASWDPVKQEWFNVYGTEDRQPGEWGHWTGRGMNWNSMCAFCHNTRLRKNYDEPTDTYRTTLAEMSVGCESCHGPMKAHDEWRRAFPDVKLPDPTVRKLSRDQYFDTCGACHARRVEITGDFQPGDSFHDHYGLVTVDTTDIYYPDGQVRDENYEFAAFLGGKMHAAGVRCVDCHQPHSAKPLLPGNDLCMRCHNGKDAVFTNSPIIDPVAHSFHKPDGAGHACAGCHMPITIYMQRHPRHDHGFTIPDPLLTKQYGIPNACNRCHTDKDADWALRYCEQWYGPRMDRPSRRRAQLLAAAREGQPAAREPLLELLGGSETPYWKASAIRLLDRWNAEPKVVAAMIEQTAHPHPLVRAAAARALELSAHAGQANAQRALERLLHDPVRSVRVAAAWALRAQVDLQSLAGRELRHALDWVADQPGGQMQKGVLALARQDMPQALAHFQKAVAWDPHSAPLRHELAVALSMAGRPHEALEHMQEAVRLEPKEPEYHFKLALAWNEVGSLKQAVAALEKTVALDSRHARAWYNLGLARHAQGQAAEALEALQRAESADPGDARIPYATATILAQLGRRDEARAAAERALDLQRPFPEAEALLNALRPPPPR